MSAMTRMIVAVEDQLDQVPDGGELDERADQRDADVALEIGALPDRYGHRQSDQNECGCHV